MEQMHLAVDRLRRVCVCGGQALRSGTAPPEQPVHGRALPDTNDLAAERPRRYAPQAEHMQVSMADPKGFLVVPSKDVVVSELCRTPLGHAGRV